MEDIIRPRRKYLPFEDWPYIDRRAWEGLFIEGDIFEDAGPGRHWRSTTRETNRRHYAYWLGWLARQGRLDPGLAPAGRVTPQQIEAYATNLTDTIRPCSVASAMIGLKEVITHIAPEGDWRWLKDICNRFNVWAKPGVDRRSAMRPIEEINRAARSELDRLLQTSLRRRIERVAYRDTLIVLLLSACPVRLKNLSSIRPGVHLVQKSDRWLLRFDETETKNGQRLDYILPRHVDPYLAVYQARIRPSFNPEPGCDALWLGFQGGALKAHSIYGRIVTVTERLLGVAINPHLFRSCAATSLVEGAPEAARLAAPLLGHRYFATTERYYVKATQLLATRRVNGAIGALLAELVEEEDHA